MTMKKKIVWMLVSCLMALSLIMASCGPAAEVEEEEEEEAKEWVVIGEEEEEEEVVEEEVISPDKPKYGGTITLALGRGDPNVWLPWSLAPPEPVQMCNEWVWNGDWARGYAGG